VIDQQQMAKLHAERLGFSHWRAASHGEHLHIAASRANGDGSVVPDGGDFGRGEESGAELEREFHLVQIPPSHLRDRSKSLQHVRAPTQEEMAVAATGNSARRRNQANDRCSYAAGRYPADTILYHVHANLVVWPTKPMRPGHVDCARNRDAVPQHNRRHQFYKRRNCLTGARL
jgi:hypothetical protein